MTQIGTRGEEGVQMVQKFNTYFFKGPRDCTAYLCNRSNDSDGIGRPDNEEDKDHDKNHFGDSALLLVLVRVLLVRVLLARGGLRGL
jgi:hypothetical protein